MAEDNGTGAVAAAGALGAMGLIPFAGSAMAAAKMVADMESMSTFKKEVDKILVDLEGSDAAPDKVSAERLERSHLGKPEFRESAYLYGAYSIVHDELEKLSKILALQIDGLSIAVQASQEGYENIDYDIRQRMRRLASETAPQRQDQAQQSGVNHAGGGGSQSGTEEYEV
ncbi:hypothetical protein ACFWDI_31550 [Streptomyces sp. NPDC060064]|uniref:hypothetical protein n=1 Tax=Streptomyces sp. NPDC060064 TaxID=3347049 RepID=UPI0036CE54A6